MLFGSSVFGLERFQDEFEEGCNGKTISVGGSGGILFLF